jgi:hypothetical protein
MSPLEAYGANKGKWDKLVTVQTTETTPAIDVYGAIKDKWDAMGGALGALGQPLDNEADTPNGGRAQTFQKGLVSWHPETGAHVVWGLIGQRWIELGREAFAFPITDEINSADGVGRFNHFRAVHLPGKPESSIYWSAASGAHEVYGAIRDKWAELGWEQGICRYPVEAEHDQQGAGRTQRFQGGVITWTAQGGTAEHEISGDTAAFDTGTLDSDLPLGGSAHLVVFSNGNFSFSGHAHDSGFSNISYGLAAVLVTATGAAFTLTHQGHVEGTIAGLPFGTPDRNDDFRQDGHSDELAQNWATIQESGRLFGTLTGEDKLVGALQDLLSGAAKAAAAAGVAAAIALL